MRTHGPRDENSTVITHTIRTDSYGQIREPRHQVLIALSAFCRGGGIEMEKQQLAMADAEAEVSEYRPHLRVLLQFSLETRRHMFRVLACARAPLPSRPVPRTSP